MTVDPAQASKYIVNPLTGRRVQFAKLFTTHPPMEDRVARLRAGGTPGAVEYRHALRDVVTHCIHGVDRNPMALELARMAPGVEAEQRDDPDWDVEEEIDGDGVDPHGVTSARHRLAPRPSAGSAACIR